MSEITVWREYEGRVERVGALREIEGEIHFAYDTAYDGQAISALLPVQNEAASAADTACFFSALIPEGAAHREFAHMLHAENGEYSAFLQRLNDEFIGALLFSVGDATPYGNPSYREIETEFFENLAKRPLETAVVTMGRTRLSLSGGMAKVGLYRDDETERWFYPLGGAPSTHIIKAADGKRFPLETINEALCLGAARRCDFPVAECALLPINDEEPLLAIRRFDRVFEGDARLISGMPAPQRLHQEDFSQATGITLKYEPTEGHYLSLIVSTAGRRCANSFGEANLAIEYTLFDYLIGNCDNHLKNYSLLYSPAWNTCEMAPLYDIVSTVAYPELYLEMGVSFGGDRRIDHVTRAQIAEALDGNCAQAKLAFSALEELGEQLPAALEDEAAALSQQGFKEAERLAESMIEGVKARYAAVRG